MNTFFLLSFPLFFLPLIPSIDIFLLFLSSPFPSFHFEHIPFYPFPSSLFSLSLFFLSLNISLTSFHGYFAFFPFCSLSSFTLQVLSFKSLHPSFPLSTFFFFHPFYICLLFMATFLPSLLFFPFILFLTSTLL